MTTNPARLITQLRRVFERRERDRAPVRTVRVLGRNTDGTERLQRSDATCVTRGAVAGNYSGQVILEPQTNVFHRQGSIDIAPVSQAASTDTLWIDRLEPSDLRPGETYVITVTGRGFTGGVLIDFLDPADSYLFQPNVLNDDITIDSLVVEDDSTLSLTVSVAPGARLWPAGAPIAFGRPT